MNKKEILSNAISSMDDRFIQEAYEHRRHRRLNRRIWQFGIAAAGICIAIVTAAWLSRGSQPSVTVYACDSDVQLTVRQPVLLPGVIDDNGRMKGHPLMFYVLGSGIEQIRFSCKNEWISFMDWTEQRDDFGLGKNFTVPYGDHEEDYYYLVVDWIPENVIRKLTDNTDIVLADLQPEEKEDVIVMEITYLDGGNETLAVNISLNAEGQFTAYISAYKITDEDEFVFRQDSLPIVKEHFMADITEENTEKQFDRPTNLTKETSDSSEVIIVTLTQEELSRIEETIEKYYVYIHRSIIDYAQVTDPESPFFRERFIEYDADEVVVFEVNMENSEINRFITIGSKDGWITCDVLDEGY